MEVSLSLLAQPDPFYHYPFAVLGSQCLACCALYRLHALGDGWCEALIFRQKQQPEVVLRRADLTSPRYREHMDVLFSAGSHLHPKPLVLGSRNRAAVRHPPLGLYRAGCTEPV